jgi:membrane protease YdiL (CAAX protease family)
MLFFAVWILDPVISGLLRQMGVLLAAALFAIPHGYPPNSTLTVFAFGVVLGWVYLRSRSLPRLVIAHWIFNLAVMNRYLHD